MGPSKNDQVSKQKILQSISQSVASTNLKKTVSAATLNVTHVAITSGGKQMGYSYSYLTRMEIYILTLIGNFQFNQTEVTTISWLPTTKILTTL